MSNYTKIYWLTRLDSLHTILGTIIVLAIIGFIIYMIVYAVNTGLWDEDEIKVYKKNWGWLKNIGIPISILLGIMAALIPTKNEAILIMAGGKTMDYIQSDTSLSKIPYKTTALITEYLDKTLKEMKDSK